MDSVTLTAGHPSDISPLSRHAQAVLPSDGLEVFSADPLTSQPERRPLDRATSTSSTKVDQSTATPSKNATLKKNPSLRKRASLSRHSSRRSLRAGEKSIGAGEDREHFNNVFHTPIPTTGNPTDILANRFQAWRKLLKDLITYFREIQSSYENRSKSLLKVSNVINNTHSPPIFMSHGGLSDAITTLRGFHKVSLTEANKARDIEDDVIVQLNGLRNDLNQKIKEIKSLSDDFKNSVEKKKESTRKAVTLLQDALNAAESDSAGGSGKSDPYIIRLSVERQAELQIEEENYLHRAYLNLEGSGRELESIVVGEIQKAYNAYVGILRREADHRHEIIDELRSGPIAMPKDHEWASFVEQNDQFVNPNVPLRQLQDISYPGKSNPSAMEIRSGMLERKSKYLKSYTPGWYVLSATHLHEFKSGDHLHTQTPVMSLYLLDQKLGSRSQPDATSHKFSFKGRQAGTMHRGHSWVFRAESHDTMMAWYDDIQILTEKTSAERNAFVRMHAHSVGGGSHKAASVSSDGLGAEEEEDAEPYSGNLPLEAVTLGPEKWPEPGGRFPSDVDVTHGLQAPISPSSNGSMENKDYPVRALSSPFTGQHLSNGDEPDAINRTGNDTGTSFSISSAVIDGRLKDANQSAPPMRREESPVTKTDGEAENMTQIQELPTTSSSRSITNLTTDGVHEGPITNGTPIGGAVGDSIAADAAARALDTPDLQDEAAVDITHAGKGIPRATAIYPTPATGLSGESAISTNQSLAQPPTQAVTATEYATHMSSSVARYETSMSASELHVPGEFPPTPAEA